MMRHDSGVRDSEFAVIDYAGYAANTPRSIAVRKNVALTLIYFLNRFGTLAIAMKNRPLNFQYTFKYPLPTTKKAFTTTIGFAQQ